MTLLAIDIGTTHLKAGLFTPEGQVLRIASRSHSARMRWLGITGYDPEELWAGVQALLAELHARPAARQPVGTVQAIGVTGMAESGLLVDAVSGAPRTPLIPWFETAPTAQTEAYRRQVDLQQVFLRTGLHPTYKYSLMKLLWLKHQAADLLPGAMWLSAEDYVVMRLCGERRTDYTLAERTCAFRIDKKTWDIETLVGLGLPGDLFPPAGPSGELAGGVLSEHAGLGLPVGIPVSVAGHDHVCGAFAALSAAGADEPRVVFDSLGTAETLIGLFPWRPLAEADYHTGFTFGLASDPARLYWLGGLSTSGGSVEWLRGILGDPALSYADLQALLNGTSGGPTGILYFPYLAGSGSPHSDSLARGAFLGLSAAHTRADLVRAVLEGCAFEMEHHRRKAEQVIGTRIERVVAAGGGTRNPVWMQIKADVYGCAVDMLEQEETSLFGAALLAGIGAGVYLESAKPALSALKTRCYTPDPERSREYKRLFDEGFLKNEAMIRSIRY